MALILNIETATTNCSVSLSKNGETLFLKEDMSLGFSHAELLHLFIDEVFKSTKTNPSSIDAIAVSKGPGSYTGLRIGVSSAKGLCYALNKPLIAIDTLEILSRQLQIDSGLIVPMLDARRMEVYSAIYNAKYVLQREIQAQILNEESFKAFLDNQSIYFIGSGVEKTKALIQHPNAIFINGKLPSANEMALLSYLKYKKSDTEDVAYFEPYYLKDFIALKKKS
ncbi:tRNA (adenosine(37)-N6)-threonylcarbamoyltransferase complex dimerization subunit type 1 TsaB [Winogradskyella aurantia]|uniref:tRNA (Adenosine(37)-N6)-threonylcarbamoyltransferase complex dimerization subunit type 1 TsaB n=1 Tax=Winogradskyella aurantia TaxID=1915063 RepID=A0A265V0S5_9FLAO|nr:tRNA (adenosine(37)-N6)-threonylcarbamoyltransferase complex dimerization subunit type 1 TsaB [Winogradskyella aurantia]OZV71146.1 tRNA (adenosine(37)-N6)-threonylcarbamoyltransferase complex dimerization subunit type 1 TsaB [Winogradskyella aurantia]